MVAFGVEDTVQVAVAQVPSPPGATGPCTFHQSVPASPWVPVMVTVALSDLPTRVGTTDKVGLTTVEGCTEAIIKMMGVRDERSVTQSVSGRGADACAGPAGVAKPLRVMHATSATRTASLRTAFVPVEPNLVRSEYDRSLTWEKYSQTAKKGGADDPI